MSSMTTCPRCGSSMVKGLSKGSFIGWREDGMTGKTETIKFMCTGCGYIEERAVNSQHLKKTQ